ncbi:MAG: hypothetical protein JWN29_2825 [Acidimicrobiales bacterium]|jgi:hypothetical protein|nr:hypothetical protein [Acidimicrobiales bacterium]
MFTLTKKKIAAGLVVAGVTLTASLAYAYWTQDGSGTGSATAGTTTSITVNQTSTVTGLYPGGTPSALSGDFTNPNSNAVTISSVTAAVTAVSPLAGSDFATTGKPNCTTGDFAIGGTSGARVVPVGTNVGSWSGLTLGLVAGAGNQDNCKGAGVTITYTANA